MSQPGIETKGSQTRDSPIEAILFAKANIVRNPDKRPQPAGKAILIPDHQNCDFKQLHDVFSGLTAYQTLSHLGGNGKGPVETPAIWDVSISTMWGIWNFPYIEDFFIAAKRLGFSKIELNHQISTEMLSGIELDRYPISSIHEPCPADISVETLKERDWLISAVDEDCRRQGVASIKRSIDLAGVLGVGVVVMHAGNVRGNQALENKVYSLFKSGFRQSQEFLEAKSRLVDERNLLIAPRLEAVKRSLKELLDYSGRSGVRLVLENRYHYLDIPGLDEMELLLDLAGPDQLGFVFDVGHAQTLDRLGFYPFEEWLKRFAARLLVVHLHDVIGIHDHLAPGLGEVDFTRLAAYLPEDALRTVELEGSNRLKQVSAGIKYLADKGCIKRQEPRDRFVQVS
jgi:sugar phosphate isomerase/epimerase